MVLLSRRFRRRSSPLRRLGKAAAYLVLGLLLLDTLTLLKHHRHFEAKLRKHTYAHPSALPTPARGQKIFICAQLWTRASVIEAWADAVLRLVDTLGAENVYVSIYESGSLDNTKELLAELDAELAAKRVGRSVVLDDETHADLIDAGPFDDEGEPRPGWVLPPSGSAGKELRRIPHLARTRNLSLQPLLEQARRNARNRKLGRIYDRILFLNDVVFTPQDVLSLLATNGGSYSVACALDYDRPARLATFYDTFALRDANGRPALTGYFPYFKAEASRHPILRGDSAPVRSCWNGMLLMDASPFYNSAVVNGDSGEREEVEGLRFRAISDSLASKHLEGSECCLIHADLAAMGAAEHGIYVNPAVRVGYSAAAYELTHAGPDADGFIAAGQYLAARWLYRVNWLQATAAEATARKVHKRLAQWEKDDTLERRQEPGEMCLIDEMHLLVWNGWRHV